MILPSSQKSSVIKPSQPKMAAVGDPHGGEIPMELYARFGITDSTDYSAKKPSDFPVMSDFYDLCEEEYMTYDRKRKYLYTEEVLQEVCLGIHSMCVGSESKYFNGHTNITDDSFLCFGVKGLLDTNKRLKDAMLFNILSYMSNKLLGEGNTVASIDEMYLFLSNPTAIEYIRNAMKRVRKKDSSVILASQNIDDFLIPSIKEFTKPLFSIPTHHFLFYPGNINPKDFEDALMIEPNEYDLIKFAERGTCYLFKHLNSSPKFLVVPGVGDFADRQIYLSMIW